MGDYWSEVDVTDSALERERQDADLREWEQELRHMSLRRDDPVRTLAADAAQKLGRLLDGLEAA